MSPYQDDFPIIGNLKSAEKPYIYLDSAATTLKPRSVIDAVSNYYTHCGANVHRGNYKTSEQATILYEQARMDAAALINAKKHELIFTRGTTDSINFLADLLELKKEDLVVNCLHDHHSNFIVWDEKARLMTLNMTSNGCIDLQMLEECLKKNKVTLLSITYASNVTGTIQPVLEAIALAKKYHALVCIDGAQIISHRLVDMDLLGADFFVFSSHKLFGPSGVGVLYIREHLLEDMPYKRFGGGMVNVYTPKQQLYKRPPLGFEAGTPAIEAVIGLGAAIDYLQQIGFDAVNKHLAAWTELFLKRLETSSWKLAFPRPEGSLALFTLRPQNPATDLAYLARLLSDTYNIAVNDGQQCCGPLYAFAEINSGLRISAHLYNSLADVDSLFNALEELSFFSQ
jgi:cysteine desulfurase/selenocysteine lyase